MINRHPDPNNPPPDLIGQMADAAGMSTGALLGRPEATEEPGNNLLTMAQEAKSKEPMVVPAYSPEQIEDLLEKAYDLVAEINVEGNKTYLLGSIAATYGWLGQVDEAKALLKDLNQFKKFWGDLGRALAFSGHIEEAKAILPLVPDEESQWRLKSQIAYEYARDGQMDAAKNMAEAAAPGREKMLLAGALADCGEFELFEQAEAELRAGPGDAKEYEDLFWIQARLGRLDEAEQTLKVNIRQPKSEAAFKYSYLLSFLVAKGQTEHAMELLKSEIPGADMKDAYAFITSGFLQADKLDDAIGFIETIEPVELQDGPMLEIATDFAEQGDMVSAMEWYGSMAEASDWRLAAMARAAAGGGFLKTALELANKIGPPLARAQAFVDIAATIGEKLAEASQK